MRHKKSIEGLAAQPNLKLIFCCFAQICQIFSMWPSTPSRNVVPIIYSLVCKRKTCTGFYSKQRAKEPKRNISAAFPEGWSRLIISCVLSAVKIYCLFQMRQVQSPHEAHWSCCKNGDEMKL